MTGAGPLSIREVARRIERDVKGVHGDVHALVNAGILQKTEAGLIVFPFDAVHVDIMLHAAQLCFFPIERLAARQWFLARSEASDGRKRNSK
jgi:hypothetical protein